MPDASPSRPGSSLDTTVGAPVLGSSPHRRKSRSAHNGSHSRAGSAIILIMAVSVPTVSFVARVVDGAARGTDFNGRVIWIASGNANRVLLAVSVTASCAIAAGTILRHVRMLRVDKAVALYLLFIAWVGFSYAMQAETSPYALGQVLILLLLATGVALSPPDLGTLRALAYVLIIVLISSVAFAVTTGQGTAPCRSDKCGVTGQLLTGYFSQENVFASFVALTAPCLLALRRRRYRWLSAMLAVGVVAATGSRTGLFSIAVTGIAALTLSVSRDRARAASIRYSLGLLPLIGVAFSAIAYLSLSDDAFTDRGKIYQALRSELQGEALIIGSGSETLGYTFAVSRTLSYLPEHEHGQVPYVVAQSGLVGLLLFLLAIAAMARRLRRLPAAMLLMAVAPGTYFVLETVWQLDLRHFGVWSLLLVIGLCGRGSGSVAHQQGHRSR